MKTTAPVNAVGITCLLVLTLGLMLGCGSDDSGGDDAAATVEAGVTTSTGTDTSGEGSIVTNIVATTNSSGGISYVTNLVFVPSPLSLLLPAPEQISPVNGQEFLLFPPATEVTVNFEWTDVPGADKYNIDWKEAGAPGYSVTAFYPTTPRFWKFPAGTYTWKIYVRVDGVAQQESPLRTFTVK